jgi:crotonobetainyl-CoA:carnitine CoA-transferase CaiB-like acyl-CoA transferase
MEALMGHGLLRGYPELDAAFNSSVLFSDAAAGALASFAVMTALYQRHRTGKGQKIDLAQAEAVAQTYAQGYMDYAMNGRQQQSLGNRDIARAPQGVYPSLGDDCWVAISCGDDAEFRALCDVIGHPSLAADKRFASSLERYNNQDDLDSYITEWTKQRSNVEAFHALQAAGVTAGPVYIQPDVMADPQLKARDVWQLVNVRMTGTHPYLKPIIGRMSKTPLSIRSAAPSLGQDNEYVYRELLGYSDAEYQWFVDNDHAGTQFLFQRAERAKSTQP